MDNTQLARVLIALETCNRQQLVAIFAESRKYLTRCNNSHAHDATDTLETLASYYQLEA